MTLFEESIALLRSLIFEEGNTFLGFLTAAGFLIVWGVLVSFLFFLFAKKRIPLLPLPLPSSNFQEPSKSFLPKPLNTA